MSINNHYRLLGRFEQYDDAVTFARAKRAEHHGEYARDN
jgi:hypothetical protein